MKIKYVIAFQLFLTSLLSLAQHSDESLRCTKQKFYENGQLMKCKLENPTVVQGFPCEKWIHFKENGKLIQFFAGENFSMGKQNIPKGTIVCTKDDGSFVCMFQQATKINGIMVKGKGVGYQTSFYDDGSLKECFPCEDLVIDGVPCKKTAFHSLGFFKSGKLKSCKLSDDFTKNEKTFKKNTCVVFDESGNVISTVE